jgi:hypothetical protein
VTHDARSFLIDGRRIWLVGGRVPYVRLSRDQWASRIHQARLAGLNTIETPVVWNRHEVRPGRFDFTADNDLRHFVDLVGKAGMYCVLSLGPYQGPGWDFGGLPAHLQSLGPKGLRTAVGPGGGPFLDASAKFLTAVADQIRGWQVTAPGAGGPIVMLRLESGWSCGHDALAGAYLGELTRYCREAGLNVPIVNSNNLWNVVEGQIDGWSGSEAMLPTMRQLASVRPTAPRMVIDLDLSTRRVWGREDIAPPTPDQIARRLLDVCAGGGQFVLTSFCSAPMPAFSGGRLGDGPGAFAATSPQLGAIVDDAGQHGAAFESVRRIAHFASRFGRVLSNLDPAFHPISLLPLDAADAQPGSKRKPTSREPAASGVSIVHATGAQGGAVFLFDDPANAGRDFRAHALLLADGTTLEVPLVGGGLAWCLLGVNVTPRCRVDYANLSTLGAVGQALSLFGPAGATGIVSVNGSPVEFVVPQGDAPLIVQHEGLTLVVVSDERASAMVLADDALYLGAAGLTPEGVPIAPAGAKSCVRIGVDGASRTHAFEASRKKPVVGKVTHTPWQQAALEDYAAGESARYATIPRLAELVALGCASGYGWYRFALSGGAGKTGSVQLMFPSAGDRLHLYLDGKPVGLVGEGPGATLDAKLTLRKGKSSLVVLADNLGRFSEGTGMGEGKGIFGEAYVASRLKVAPPKLAHGRPIEALTFRTPLWEVSEGDVTAPMRITWTITHKRKTPVVMRFLSHPSQAILAINDTPVQFLDSGGPRHVVLSEEQLAKGTPTVVQIAMLRHGDVEAEFKRLAGDVEFYEGTAALTTDTELGFAKWEPPSPSQFKAPAKVNRHLPTWWRTTFTTEDASTPLLATMTGLTKGQFYVNGKHVGRYFAALPSGKPVPPQDRYLIPSALIKAGEPNELMIFDEHGAMPGKVKLEH